MVPLHGDAADPRFPESARKQSVGNDSQPEDAQQNGRQSESQKEIRFQEGVDAEYCEFSV